jgi:hypothetical protein
MSRRPWRVRPLLLAAAATIVAAGLAVRAAADGALAQHSGTALYASMVWTGVLFVRPRLAPLAAGAVAIGCCWLVEAAQLTGVPAALSARSTLARLALGAQFDPADLAWYPVGVVPFVGLHLLLRRTQSPPPDADVTS